MDSCQIFLNNFLPPALQHQYDEAPLNQAMILPSIEDEGGGERHLSHQPQGRGSQKAQEFKNDQRRPNVHVAVHYEAVMQEYGMPSNLNVLIGEDEHR